MPTIRGQSGWMSLGGHLFGSQPLIDGAVAEAATVVSVRVAPGSALYGAVAPGDTFTVAGVAGTYTVSLPYTLQDGQMTPIWPVVGSRITALSFTPAAPVGGFPDGAAFTLTSVDVVQLVRWQVDFDIAAVESTVMRQAWRTFVPFQAAARVAAGALFDRGDPQQAALLTAVTSGSGTLAVVTLGAEDLPIRSRPWEEPWELGQAYRPYWLARACVIAEAQVVSDVNNLVAVAFRLVAREALRPRGWEEGWEMAPLASELVLTWSEGWEG